MQRPYKYDGIPLTNNIAPRYTPKRVGVTHENPMGAESKKHVAVCA